VVSRHGALQGRELARLTSGSPAAELTPMSLRRGIQGLFGVGVLGVIYCASGEAGPYRWLAELSLSHFGSYSPKLVFLATLFIVLLPSALAMRLATSRSAAAAAEHARSQAEQAARMARIQPGLMLAVVGAVFLFLGGRDLLQAEAGATLVRTSCASIEAGGPPAGTWLSISGITIPDAAVSTRESYVNHRYVPLVSDSWSKRRPLAVVLRFDGDEKGDLNASSFEGGVSSEDLPGMVRATYEAEGVQAGSALVLVVGKRPGKHLTRNRIMSAAGLLGLLVGAFLIWRKWR
jgi:hypothetical protein